MGTTATPIRDPFTALGAQYEEDEQSKPGAGGPIRPLSGGGAQASPAEGGKPPGTNLRPAGPQPSGPMPAPSPVAASPFPGAPGAGRSFGISAPKPAPRPAPQPINAGKTQAAAPADPFAALGAKYEGSYPGEATVAPHSPSMLDAARLSIANSAIGHSLEQAMPKVADVLHLHPTETFGSPEFEQHKAQLFNPEPLVETPTMESIPSWERRLLPKGEIRENVTQPKTAVQQVSTGVAQAAGGLTTPGNLAFMAAPIGEVFGLGGEAAAKVLPRLLSAGFTAQMIHGLYQQAKEYKEAKAAGRSGTAEQILGQMLITAPMLLMAGAHATGLVGHGAPAERPAQEAPVEAPAPQAEANVPRGSVEPTEATGTEEHPPIGEKEAETGRTVLQQSPRPEVTQAAATAEHPAIKDQLAKIAEPIDGAKLAGARDEKDGDRLEEKMEAEGQSPRTVRDYSGFRIAVDSPAAKDQVVQSIRDRFEVPEESDEFHNGAEETGFHGHTLQVREPGSPVTHEVQVLPREVAENADERHGLYEKAREGDKDAASELKAANEADWQRFADRNSTEKEGRGQSPEQPVAGALVPQAPRGEAPVPAAVNVRERLAAFLGRAIKRDAMEAQGQRVLDEMEDRDESPRDAAKKFWSDTYFKLPPGVQEMFRRYTKSQSGFEPGDVIGQDRDGKPIVANDWSETLDLPSEVRHLEGTERGLVSMMAEANRRFGAGGEADGAQRPEPAAAEPKFKFGSTQANIPPDSEAAAALKSARESIAPQDRAGDVNDATGGLVENPHVTVRYGIKGGDTAKIRRFIESQAPFEATLGATDTFPPSEHSDGAAAIIAPVESPEFHRIEREIEPHGDFAERSFPEYKPHATLAYVKPEAAEKYKGMDGTAGKRFLVRSISIMDRDGHAEEVPLKVGGAQRPEGMPAEREGDKGSEEQPAEKGAQPRETSAAAVQPNEVGRVPVAELHADPKRFQYKMSATSEAGTTDLLKGRRWNDALAGVISVWRDPADGKVYVVNGHHRFELASSSGVPHMNVLMLEAPDAATARSIGALQNIAEGRGTPMDAAKFFRDSGYTPADLDRIGVSMGEATAANGMALARLDQRLFDDVVTGKLRQNRAIAIGRATDKPEEQDAILKLIEKAEARGRKVSDDTVDELARMAKGAGEHTETQQTLFGAQEMTRNLALEKAEVSSYIRDEIGKEKRIFSSVADEKKAGRLSAGGNKINAAKNRDIADRAREAQELYDRLSTRSGDVDEILNRSARALAEGKENPNAVKQRSYEEVRAALSKALSGATGGEPEGVREGAGAAQEERPAAQRSQGLKAPVPPEQAAKPRQWAKGDRFLVRDPATGNWKAGEVTYWNEGGNPQAKAGGRSKIGDARLDEVPRDALPLKLTDEPMKPVVGTDLERDIIERTKRELPRLTGEYLEKHTQDGVPTLANDAAKELYPEFRSDPTATDRQAEAGAKAVRDSALATALSEPVDPRRPDVLVTTGSPGSGKTTGQAAGGNPDGVGIKVEAIADNLKNFRGLLQRIIDSGRRPVVNWVYIDDPAETVRRMFNRALGRPGKPGIGRTVQLEYMAHSYVDVPRVLSQLKEEMGDRLRVVVVDNSGPKGSKPVVSEDLAHYADKIQGRRYNDVLGEMEHETRRLQSEGRFEGERGHAILKAAQERERGSRAEPRPGGAQPETVVGQGGGEIQPRSGLGGPVLGSTEGEAKPPVRQTAGQRAGGSVSPEEFKAGLEAARKRSVRENAASQQARVVKTPEGGQHLEQAVVLDPDAYAVWHRGALGERTAWRGVTLPRAMANKVEVLLRAMAGSARAEAGGAEAAAGYDRLVKTLREARHADGSVTLLRGDYRPDTVREEAWHNWQRKHGALDSDALREIAQGPEVRAIADRLRDMGYGVKGGVEGRTELAMEMMAKALAGDPDLEITPDQRYDLVHRFLSTAVGEFGPRILEEIPDVTPEAEAAVAEARRSYEAEPDEAGRGEAARGEATEAGGRAERGPGVGERPLHPGRGGQPAVAGDERGAEEAGAAENQLEQHQRARKPVESLALPGMEGADRERDAARGEAEAKLLSDEMRRPKADISQAAGRMERESPLFFGTGENPGLFPSEDEPQGSLFQRAKEDRDAVTDTPEFKRWFGGSKALDADGKPKIVYHGTAHSFDTFDPGRGGARTIADTGDFGRASYFADSPATAARYADSSKATQKGRYVGPDFTEADLKRLRDDPQSNASVQSAARKVLTEMVLGRSPAEAMASDGSAALAERLGGKMEEAGAAGQVLMPVYLRAENPLVLGSPASFERLYRLAGGMEKWLDLSPDAQAKLIQDAGFDAVHDTTYGQWAVYDPKQVKSAIGNSGAFSRDTASILYQREGDENPVARSVQDLVEALAKDPHTDGRSALQKVADWTGGKFDESAGRAGREIREVPSRLERAWAKSKLVTAALVDGFRHPLKATDWKKSVGQMDLARVETALKLHELSRQIKDAAPDKLTRIGITHWIEAGGDPNKLDKWAESAKARWQWRRGDPDIDARLKNHLADSVEHYEAARKLTPEQKLLGTRIKQHLDDMLTLAKSNGLLEYGARNYVRHLYEAADAADLTKLLDTNEINPNPGFIEKRIFQSYFEAENHGMIPRDKDVGYLVSAYDKSFNQALASRGMMKSLLDGRAADGRPLAAIRLRGKWVLTDEDQRPLVIEQRERPKSLTGYKGFDHAPTRNFLFEPTREDLEGYEYDPKLFEEDPARLAFRGDLIFHPEVADRIDDMLTPGWFDRNENVPQKVGHAIMKGSSLAKETMTLLAPFHLVQLAEHSVEHWVNPTKLPEIDMSGKSEESRIQRLLASNGLGLVDFDAEGLFSARALKGLFEGVPGLNVAMDGVNALSRWQFEDVIPRMKMKMARTAFDRNWKSYGPKIEAQELERMRRPGAGALSQGEMEKMARERAERMVAELTAKQANAAFGNLNHAFDSVHRSKTFKQLLRLTLFAPDFLESRIRYTGQALTRYGGEQRAALLRGALGMWVIARVANAMLNKGDTKNDLEHAFTVVAAGRNFSLRSQEGDILHLIDDPRGFIYNRINPLTTRPIIEYLSGRDQFGRQKSGVHVLKDEAKSVLPFGVQKIIETPDQGWINSLLSSAGVTTSNYRSPAEEMAHKVYIQSIPDMPDDPDRRAESRSRYQLAEAIREGKKKPQAAIDEAKEGKITMRQAWEIIDRSQHSELYNEFRSGAVSVVPREPGNPSALDIYAKATPAEQMELRPLLIEKGENQLPEIRRDAPASDAAVRALEREWEEQAKVDKKFVPPKQAPSTQFEVMVARWRALLAMTPSEQGVPGAPPPGSQRTVAER